MVLPMKRATIKDVAALAGVSSSAVSRSFGDGTHVSKATQRKVLAAAESLGYRPNALARSLVGARTGLVALVVGRLRSPFDSLFVDALAESLIGVGKHLLLSPVRGDERADDGLMRALDYQVDAVVVAAGTMSPEVADRFARMGVPLILSGRVVDGAGIDCVLADNAGGAAKAAELLLRTGCKRIAYIGRGHGAFSDDERRRGLRDTLRRLGLDIVAEARAAVDREDGHPLGMELLSGPNRPDAVFCMNDALAVGVIEAARDLGLRLPEDLAVVGFDDIPLAAAGSYQLTTVAYPIQPTVAAIVETLEDRLAGADWPSRVIRIPTRLMVRRTTRRLERAVGARTRG